MVASHARLSTGNGPWRENSDSGLERNLIWCKTIPPTCSGFCLWGWVTASSLDWKYVGWFWGMDDLAWADEDSSLSIPSINSLLFRYYYVALCNQHKLFNICSNTKKPWCSAMLSPNTSTTQIAGLMPGTQWRVKERPVGVRGFDAWGKLGKCVVVSSPESLSLDWLKGKSTGSIPTFGGFNW